MIKTPSDLNFMRMSSQSAIFFAKALTEELETIISQEMSISHKKIAEKMENLLEKNQKKIKESLGFSIESLDFTYSPVIQSGGYYDFRPQAESNGKNLSFDTIIWNLAVKYMNFNSAIVRTFFINASNVQKEAYEKACGVFEKTVQSLKPGVVIKELYKEIVEDLKRAHGVLAEKKPVHFGFGVILLFFFKNA